MFAMDKSLKVVPWFSTEEWDYVCKLVYSNDVEKQTRGYEHLLVWKTRVQSLPASVACTLELLQVRLQDHSLWPKVACGEVPPYTEQELRLAYSTVIMRFLNHLASLFQNTQNQTLYSVAKKLHIPVWVVNIRHDAAHDGNLPSVDVLRLAAGYAFRWLHEYWWKPEALRLSDWKLVDDDVDDMCHVELCNLLDLWQALKLYQETDYNTVDQIPDKEVIAQVSILHSKIDSNLSYNESTPDNEIEVTADYNSARGMSIHAASTLVLLNIKKFVREIIPVHEWDQIVLNNLVGDGMFSPSLITDEDWPHVENNKLPHRSLKIWKPILTHLPVAVLLRLVQKLLTLTCSMNGVVSNQSRLAALWIHEVAMAVTKLHRVLDLVEEISATASVGTDPTKTVELAKGIFIKLLENDKLAKLAPKSLYKKLVARVEAEYPELKDVLVLSVTPLPGKKEIYEIVKFAVLNPSRLTPIFLPSVLKLVDLPTSPDMYHNLMLLVKLYTQFENVDAEVDVDGPVFNVSNLTSTSTIVEECAGGDKSDPLSKDSGVEDMEVEGHHCDQLEQNVSKSHWQHVEVNTEWSKCPLGILPWQQDQILVDLTIPNCTWQLSEEMEPVTFINKLPQLFCKAIEWEDVKRKRVKKKGNPKLNGKIIKTALETISRNTV